MLFRSGVGGLADVIRSPIYATAVGLTRHGARRHGPGTAADSTLFGRLARRVSGFLNDIF